MSTRRTMPPETRAFVEIGKLLDQLSRGAQARLLGYFTSRMEDTETAADRAPEDAPTVTHGQLVCHCGRPQTAHDLSTGKVAGRIAADETPCEGWLPRRNAVA